MNIWVEKFFKKEHNHGVRFKYEQCARVLFLNYRRPESYKDAPSGVMSRHDGHISNRKMIDGKPTYNIVLSNGDGVLRNVPERNLRPYTEPNNLH